MALNKIYIGDVGTEILVDCKADILNADVTQIRVLKPSGAEGLWHSIMVGTIGSITINAGGLGYVEGDMLDVIQGSGSNGVIRVASVATGGIVTGLQIENGGDLYEVKNTVPTEGGSGTGCKINITALSAATTLKYFILTGDLNEAGIYILQARIRLPQWDGLGESVNLEVYDRFK